ncbi:2699_t:CDS:2 [Ambispora leptoticha]|uniref:2699_t:CDS:1 n=1 Tax=Ambispora leptoticha TaxID=144679 RepID=A0A9N9B3U0_9GLOM|nr:2699_t:CDS:2 [Ambispora leptoticha]
MFDVEDLFKKNDYKYRQTLKTVNSFFIYRKAMVKQNEKGGKKCDMPKLSKISSIFWKQEEKHVKDAYKQLAKKDRDLFAKQIDSLQAINAGKSLGFPQPQLQPQTAAIHPRFNPIQNTYSLSRNLNINNNNQLNTAMLNRIDQIFHARFDQILHARIDELVHASLSQRSIKPIDYNPLFNPSGQWSTNDRHCLNVYTPPPNSVVVPFYDVWIRWNKTNECSDPVTPLTNFMFTLHNNPKNENNADSPKIKSEWEHPITFKVKKYQYEWEVPLIEEGVVKNMSLFYIRVLTHAVLSSGSFTMSGVAGPLNI